MVDYALNDYHKVRHAELIGSAELREAWGEVAEQLYFQDLQPGDRILEFGGGLGANLVSVAIKAETWMVEPAPVGREMATAAGIRSFPSLESIDSSVRFDFVLCRHCLEHVPEPFAVLSALRDRMHSGARLVLVLPVENPHLMPAANDIDFHLYAWHRRAIVNLLNLVGFRDPQPRFEFFDGRRRLLVVRRMFGSSPYVVAVRLLGRLLRSRELVKLRAFDRTWHRLLRRSVPS